MTTYEISLSDDAAAILSERAAERDITQQEYLESLLEQFARRAGESDEGTVEAEVSETLRDLGYL